MDTKRIALIPFFAYLINIPIFVYWMVATIFLYTCGTPFYNTVNPSYIAEIKWDERMHVRELLFIMLFGLFWLIAFCIAMMYFVIAATVCQWYMSYNAEGDAKRHADVWKSLGWGMLYHVGSMAFGSFLVAVIQMIKVIFEYFAKKGE